MQHGIYFQELSTEIQSLTQVESGLIVAVGTAKIPQAKPKICYTLAEFGENFGYTGDFSKYTLEEVAKTAFSLYGIAPIICINVLDFAKHSEKIIADFEGQSSFRLDGEILTDTIQITTGEFQPLVNLSGAFVADEMTVDGSDNYVKAVEIIDPSKVIGGKFKVKYRTLSTALGGTPFEVTVKVEDLEENCYRLPEDVILDSVEVWTGGESSLRDLTFTVAQDAAGTLVMIDDDTQILNDKVRVTYSKIDFTKIKAADIIGGVDAATGQATGLELVDAVPAIFNLAATFTIIAPGYSQNAAVAAAMIAKAKAVAGMFPSMAVADLEAKTYTEAIELKNNSNLSAANLILAFPKVTLNGETYNLSTHLAALMCQVDSQNEGIPFVSPSNQSLNIDGAINSDGVEIYLNQSQANLLNAAGIVTVLPFNGLKAWGNLTAVGDSTEPKDKWISVRRVFNFITAQFIKNYLSALDVPINRRNVAAILQSANLYLAALTSRGAILGGRLEFLEEDNTTAELLGGKITFALSIAPPVPAQSLVFRIQFDAGYYAGLFA